MRKRFTRVEKNLITEGNPIDWRNVSQWHPAVILTGQIIIDDGWQHVMAVNQETTRTLRNGQEILVTPGRIRPRTIPPGAGPKPVVHIRNDSTNGRDLETAHATQKLFADLGYLTAPVPADGQDHPYHRQCETCSS